MQNSLALPRARCCGRAFRRVAVLSDASVTVAVAATVALYAHPHTEACMFLLRTTSRRHKGAQKPHTDTDKRLPHNDFLPQATPTNSRERPRLTIPTVLTFLGCSLDSVATRIMSNSCLVFTCTGTTTVPYTTPSILESGISKPTSTIQRMLDIHSFVRLCWIGSGCT